MVLRVAGHAHQRRDAQPMLPAQRSTWIRAKSGCAPCRRTPSRSAGAGDHGMSTVRAWRSPMHRTSSPAASLRLAGFSKPVDGVTGAFSCSLRLVGTNALRTHVFEAAEATRQAPAARATRSPGSKTARAPEFARQAREDGISRKLGTATNIASQSSSISCAPGRRPGPADAPSSSWSPPRTSPACAREFPPPGERIAAAR